MGSRCFLSLQSSLKALKLCPHPGTARDKAEQTFECLGIWSGNILIIINRLKERKSLASLALHLPYRKRTDLHQVPGGAYGLAGKCFQFPIRLSSP
jgi:hypothetical protein